MTAKEPFTISISDETLADLRSRLARTRWPDQVQGAGWDYGADLSYLQALVDYWLHSFDWRKQERFINTFPQFQARVGGLRIHFVHVRGKGPNPLPLLLTNGWPSSFAELLPIVGPLADPAQYGGDPADAFDVIVPSLPGFGFSERPQQRGLVPVDRLWRSLMTDVLGYRRFVAHGTDIGARVTSALGRFHSDVVAAIHLGSVDLEWPEPLPPNAELTVAERDYLDRVDRWEKEQGAYSEIQGTFPQTVAYGLNDSPTGLAAWIVEKYYLWSDSYRPWETRFTNDDLLTNITLYWVTETMNASMRRYYEALHNPPLPLPLGERIATPTAIAMFPGETDLVVPRSWAERCYNLTRWTEMPRGGHFPALEEPALLIDDLRAAFRPFRQA